MERYAAERWEVNEQLQLRDSKGFDNARQRSGRFKGKSGAQIGHIAKAASDSWPDRRSPC
jgi:hypothetical protein